MKSYNGVRYEDEQEYLDAVEYYESLEDMLIYVESPEDWLTGHEPWQ